MLKRKSIVASCCSYPRACSLNEEDTWYCYITQKPPIQPDSQFDGKKCLTRLTLTFISKKQTNTHYNLQNNQIITFCCCMVCFHRSLAIGNMAFLCMFLRVLQYWKWEDNLICITAVFTDVKLIQWLLYLFNTLAMPKSPSCNVPSLVKNMFYIDKQKQQLVNKEKCDK